MTAPSIDTGPVATIGKLCLSLVRHGERSEVLHGVDLEIRAGEILGLVGESGSGKSVLALSLLGLLPPDSRPESSGTVTVAGVDMLRAPAAELRRVRRDALGAIFQDPMTSLNPSMRIGRQIAEVSGGDAESVSLLESVGVVDAPLRLQVFPHQLSGGLRQRVMAAIAVAGRPRLVVADEPTTALDVTVQAQLLEVLRELRDDFGCSVLLITHDLGVADRIADRIAVLHHGDLVELGPTAEVVSAPRHDYTRSLLASRLTLRTPRDGRFVGPDRTAEPALRIEGVTCVFTVGGAGRRQRVTALAGIDLEVAAGEALAIVGESGSGKSTLLRVVAGLQKPSGGVVARSRPGRVQMIYQDAGSSLTPWLSVRETLSEPLLPLRLDRTARRRRVDAALDAVGLSPQLAAARPAELSGGQRQRVALARATIVAPALLLCDEPTSALDASLASSVLALIRDLRSRLGMTVLFVTHDLAVARLMGDRIAVMRAGHVVEIGDAERIVDDPRHPYTVALLAAVPRIAELEEL